MPGRCPTHEPRALFCSAMASAAFQAFAVQCLELGAALSPWPARRRVLLAAARSQRSRRVKAHNWGFGRVIVAHWCSANGAAKDSFLQDAFAEPAARRIALQEDVSGRRRHRYARQGRRGGANAASLGS